MTVIPFRLRRAGAWLVSVWAVAACGGGDWSPYVPEAAALPEDAVERATYPAGPYGIKTGERIANLAFDSAFLDPGTLCKPASDLDITLTEGVQSLSLLDLYRGDAYCPKKKLFVWFVASAGW